MKYLLTIFIFIFICISLSAQKPKVMTAKDSAAAYQAEVNRFADSLVSKTSVKDFREFLRGALLSKVYDEATFPDLYAFFIRTKLDEWAAKRKKQ